MKLKSKFSLMAFLVVILPILMVSILFAVASYFQMASVSSKFGIIIEYSISLVVLVVAFIIIICLIAAYAIYNSWIRPVNKLNDAMQKVAEGNLDFSMQVEGTDELSTMCNNFDDMRKRLKESLEEKIKYDCENRELISNISHDLKTPITSIKGYVEGIMDGVADTPEKMDKYIKTIYNKANEMDRLINELTLYSQIDTNRIPYNFRRIKVRDYFDDCIEEIGLDLDAKGIELLYDNKALDDVKIVADPEQLGRVINNIVGNSIKYMDKEKGKITIEITEAKNTVNVNISDNGKGIAAGDLDKIFDRFYRTDASRNSAKGGSGIGLSIVKKVIEDHGGHIWAASTEGVGTTMHIMLNKYEEEANE